MSQHRPSADASAGLGRSEEATALLPTQRQQALLQTGDEEALGLSAPLRDSMARVVDAMYGDVLPTPPFEPTPDTVRDLMPRVSPAPAPPGPAPILTGAFRRALDQGEVAGFLVVEHPGPWPREAVWSLPRETASVLSQFQQDRRVRVQLGHLANRPGRTTDISVLMSVPDNEGLAVTRSFQGPEDLADVPWSTLLDELQQCVVPDGWTEAEPVMLVDQTSGMLHVDRLTRSLATADPDNVWVTSSLGPTSGVGVLALPQGLLYGSFSPGDGPELTESLWQCRVLVSRLIGRTCLSVADQVAEATLRRHLGAEAEDAVQPVSSRRSPIASGLDEDGMRQEITRVVSDWIVHPELVDDPVLARMMPDLAGQEISRWRVVVDQVDTGPRCTEPTLSVVEVTRADSPALSAGDWDAIHADGTSVRELPDPTVVSLVTPLRPGTALDLGSGQGRHSIWLAEHGWEVSAVDFSRAGLGRMADTAAERGLRVRGELADLRLWTPATALFDLVLAVDVDVLDLVQHACRWVAPGGRIIVLASNQGGEAFDHVEMAARVTGSRLRVLRASEVERVTEDGETVVESVVMAVRRR